MINEPACAVIIPHHNMSALIGPAIQSVLAQTHDSVELLIVDDKSDELEWARLRAIVSDFASPKVRLVRHEANLGQISAMFTGLRETSGEFVAFLDPDDVYEPEFLETLLRAHLNPVRIAAVASCEMGRFRVGGGMLSRNTTGFRSRSMREQKMTSYADQLAKFGYSKHYNPWETGWLWTNTSGMLFRRDALRMIEPTDQVLAYKHYGDAYCATGAHMIGGSFFVDQVLSWRGVREDNTAHPDLLLSPHQMSLKPEFKSKIDEIKQVAVDAMFANGIDRYLTVANLGEIVTTQFAPAALAEWMQTQPRIADLLRRYAANLDWDQ